MGHTIYIGQTVNLGTRLKRHNLGHGKFTRFRAPYRLMYVEKFKTRSEAMRREKDIKAYKGSSKFKNLIRV